MDYINITYTGTFTICTKEPFKFKYRNVTTIFDFCLKVTKLHIQQKTFTYIYL